MKSFSEIDTIVKRASKSLGFPWGVAEEIGKNIQILEFFGLRGVKSLNNYFKLHKQKKFQNIRLILKNNSSNISYCPIVAGLNFLDQINLLEDFGEIEFKNLAFPILFLPFVSRASEIIGKRIKLSIDTQNFLLNYNKSIYSDFNTEKIIENANSLKLNILNNVDSFSENEWKELYKMSENIFVEETDELKKNAAGAGLTDND